MQGLARERTRRVMVGSVPLGGGSPSVPLGGGSPVVVQSMTCTSTVDADATLAQVNALVDAGCDLVRVTVPSREALGPFERICHESPVPIVADIHFDYRLAIGAVRAGGCDLVRVTVPSREALGPFERICHESPVPIVADIHFDYRLAIGAVRAGAAKLSINPGNISGQAEHQPWQHR